MFRSATFKLTMWYLGIVMVISLGFSMAVYRFATNELTYGLNNQTQRIYQQFPVFTDNPYLRVRGSDVDRGAHHIFLQLAYFNVLVLVGAGFASYLLARRTLEPIEAAHNRQKRFTADVSHELRTPLTALKMGTEVALLDDKATKQELQTTLKSNLEDVGRMEQLINNLLRLTKLDSEELAANFTDLPSGEMVSSALAQVATFATSKRLRLQNSTEDALVRGDQDSLTQLLVILLDNAIKYSPTNSTVTLTSQHIDGKLRLQITDEGAGISPAALPHVFERFYREDTARTASPEGQGYGLGLSIAKMIADRNNANVMLTSQLTKGTIATVTIPLVK
ncbi:HAMP domain-containing histidine kinase [Aeromicrobium sp.]|nr:HAMP domain-containing histidine kinase [Candidatus Saccharibacteria bacterium]